MRFAEANDFPGRKRQFPRQEIAVSLGGNASSPRRKLQFPYKKIQETAIASVLGYYGVW